MAALHSPQRTAERIAELVHATPVTALHTSRILRTATDDKGNRRGLWPQPGSGARITSYTPTQMVNLLLALAAGEPIRGPEVVDGLRNGAFREAYSTITRREQQRLNALMPPELMRDPESPYSTRTTTSRFPSEPLLLEGKNLGEVLDNMVRDLGGDVIAAHVREALRATRIFLELKPRFAATIVIPLVRGEDWYAEETFHYGEEQPASPSLLVRLLAGSAGETIGAMEALATIWRENQAALRPPTNEAAAIHPCPGTNAAAPSQPSTPERKRGRATPPILSVRERALNGYAAGPPFTNTMERLNARYRQLSADSAGG